MSHAQSFFFLWWRRSVVLLANWIRLQIQHNHSFFEGKILASKYVHILEMVWENTNSMQYMPLLIPNTPPVGERVINTSSFSSSSSPTLCCSIKTRSGLLWRYPVRRVNSRGDEEEETSSGPAGRGTQTHPPTVQTAAQLWERRQTGQLDLSLIFLFPYPSKREGERLVCVLRKVVCTVATCVHICPSLLFFSLNLFFALSGCFWVVRVYLAVC